jgi:hypothetical protein
MITMIKVIFGFLFLCLLGGLFFYTIFDLKPWRKDSQLWDSEKGPGPTFLKFKKIAQEKFFNRNTWRHIKSYYAYYGLALILIAVAFTA